MPAHTVIQFVYILFDNNWEREAPNVTYVANVPQGAQEAQLAVLRADSRLSSGGTIDTLDAYIFMIHDKERVLVSYDHNLVFIPGVCVNRHPFGDLINCHFFG